MEITRLILLCVYPLLVTAQVDDCIDDTQKEWSSQLLGYKLTCANNGVLVGLDVTAGLGGCPPHKKSECDGLTPSLIEEQHNCYWKTDCSVCIPKGLGIDIIVKANGDQCFGKTPEYLQISHVTCLETSDKREIIDFSSIFPKGDPKQKGCASDAFEEGIIRSHSFYPWDYEGGSRVFDAGEYCFEIYTKNPKPGKRELKLVITVKDFDMGEQDSLSLKAIGNDSSERIDSSAIGKSFTYSAASLESGVQITMNIFIHSIGGRGFILCFAHVEYSMSNPDACAKIVSKGVKTPMFKDVTISDGTSTPTLTTTASTPKLPESCRDCKKRCRKVSKKERRKCKKSCKPPQCTKGKKGKGKKKPKTPGKKKGKKKSKRAL